MSLNIPSLPDLNFLKDEKTEPILNQIDDQNDEILKMVNPKFLKIARMIICEYSMSKNKSLDQLFKKYKDDYYSLRVELQKYIDERKVYLLNATKHLL